MNISFGDILGGNMENFDDKLVLYFEVLCENNGTPEKCILAIYNQFIEFIMKEKRIKLSYEKITSLYQMVNGNIFVETKEKYYFIESADSKDIYRRLMENY